MVEPAGDPISGSLPTPRAADPAAVRTLADLVFHLRDQARGME